jgi:hypothetical protein
LRSEWARDCNCAPLKPLVPAFTLTIAVELRLDCLD